MTFINEWDGGALKANTPYKNSVFPVQKANKGEEVKKLDKFGERTFWSPLDSGMFDVCSR